MPVKQRVNFLVGWAGDPAHQMLVENGATSLFNPIRSNWEFRECESFGRLSMRAKILNLKSQEVWVKEVIKNLSEFRNRPLALAKRSEGKPSKRIAPKLLSLLWLCAIAWVGFLWNLGNIGLVDETEPLFAEAARQMTLTGDWITPYFNGETRFDKPPLIYWLMAVAYRTLGVNEWAVRLPSALCAIGLTCLGFYTLQQFTHSKEEGSWATSTVRDLRDVREKEEVRWKPEEETENNNSKLKSRRLPLFFFYSLDWCGPNSFKSPNYCLGTDWRFRYAISRLYVFGTTRIFSRLQIGRRFS